MHVCSARGETADAARDLFLAMWRRAGPQPFHKVSCHSWAVSSLSTVHSDELTM